MIATRGGQLPTRLATVVDEAVFLKALSQSSIIAHPERLLKKENRYIVFSLPAAEQAMSQANMDNIAPNRVAVVIGAAEGGLPWIEANVLKMERGSPWRISPFCVPGTLSNMPAGCVSQPLGCCGPSECLC